ncbi:MAG: hypothetical protein M0Z82_12250 [Actinomycetota bacterium]|nr:hypothetical protein [Actinomycetota bacterium]
MRDSLNGPFPGQETWSLSARDALRDSLNGPFPGQETWSLSARDASSDSLVRAHLRERKLRPPLICAVAGRTVLGTLLL